MINSAKSLIGQSFYRLLGKIIKLALRNGITYKEFAEIGKQLFVDIAADEYGLQGRKTNMARVALITGLERKEVKRLVTQERTQANTSWKPDRMSRLLTIWHENEQYTDAKGQPLEIPIDGNTPSFNQLVKDYGGDVATITIMREFLRSQTIVEVRPGILQVKERFYVPNYHSDTTKPPNLVDPGAIAQGSSMLIDHINTIFHNLYRDDINAREKFDLRATNAFIKRDSVSEFYDLVHQKGMQFLEEIDQWLDQNEVQDPSEASERLGLGLYFIEGANDNKQDKKVAEV